VTSSELITAAFYLTLSIAGFAGCRWLSIVLSGPKASTGWYWLSISVTFFWGMVQLNTARNGSILFLDPTSNTFLANEPVRWSAFVGSLLQALCIPHAEKPRRWYWF